jgi:hypothetical protein
MMGKRERQSDGLEEGEETGILGLKRSEYSTIRLIRPVNIINQDRRRRNETIIA